MHSLLFSNPFHIRNRLQAKPEERLDQLDVKEVVFSFRRLQISFYIFFNGTLAIRLGVILLHSD